MLKYIFKLSRSIPIQARQPRTESGPNLWTYWHLSVRLRSVGICSPDPVRKCSLLAQNHKFLPKSTDRKSWKNNNRDRHCLKRFNPRENETAFVYIVMKLHINLHSFLIVATGKKQSGKSSMCMEMKWKQRLHLKQRAVKFKKITRMRTFVQC